MHLHDICTTYMLYAWFICFQKYERRGRYVHADEMDQWLQVKPNMMSDEDDCGGKFKVRWQEWRSDSFNELMETLDHRASTNKSHPRKERFYGTPQKTVPSPNAPEWMLTPYTSPGEDGSDIPTPQSPGEGGNDVLAPESPLFSLGWHWHCTSGHCVTFHCYYLFL